jgi:hypothetical protein
MYQIRRATEADAISLAPRLREADLEELQASGDHDPEESLLLGVREGDCYVCADIESGLPHVIFGTMETEVPFKGLIWMMASPALKTYWIQLLRDTRPVIDNLRGHYKILTNAVYAKNTVHIRWLRWAGFTFLREFKVEGNSFYEFAKLTPTGD